MSHRRTSFSAIARQLSGHFRGDPRAGAAHIAAIKAVSRRLAIEGFFTVRIFLAIVWITQFCKAAESESETDCFGPPKKSRNGEIRALFSIEDFPIPANRSVRDGLCQGSKLAALMAALAPATYTRLVEGRRFWSDCSKSLTTSLIGLACALTRCFSLWRVPKSKIAMPEKMVCLYILRPVFIT